MTNSKSDLPYLIGFSAAGLALAFALSGPLRHPKTMRVGTPLHSSSGPIYAEGRVELAPGLEGEASKFPVLFVIAKSAAGGPPVAVKRFDHPRFPLEFALGPENNMVGEDFFDGDLTIIARLDADGVAGPKQSRDRETTAHVSKSDRQVSLTLSGDSL